MNTATKNQIAAAHAEFSARLNSLLQSIRDSALSQFEYNLKENIGRGILTVGECAEHAVAQGVVSGVSKMHKWDINQQIELAAKMLEDVNAHREAAILFKMVEAEA